MNSKVTNKFSEWLNLQMQKCLLGLPPCPQPLGSAAPSVHGGPTGPGGEGAATASLNPTREGPLQAWGARWG